MEGTYHILNGDALKEQFPVEIEGERIVARECLVEGDVKSRSLDDFFQIRAEFIAEAYTHTTIEGYYSYTVSEFDKIKAIPAHSTVCLWFEDDLFCQVNFWFVVYLLTCYVHSPNVFIIRPGRHTPYSFGGLSKPELLQVFKEKTPINDLNNIAALWQSYQENDSVGLLRIAKKLKEPFPFILKAVEAHLARIPSYNHPGRPVQSLKNIIIELGTANFDAVFKEFSKRESIYGFGDSQVKRLLEQIKKE